MEDGGFALVIGCPEFGGIHLDEADTGGGDIGGCDRWSLKEDAISEEKEHHNQEDIEDRAAALLWFLSLGAHGEVLFVSSVHGKSLWFGRRAQEGAGVV